MLVKREVEPWMNRTGGLGDSEGRGGLVNVLGVSGI